MTAPAPARTPADTTIAPSIPAASDRDTGIDLIRALCVVGVVMLHALLVGVTIGDAGPVFANAGEGSEWIVPLSWALQVMPLFFVVGGFAGLTAYRRRRARGATAFVAQRVHRLLLPAILTVSAAAAALIALTAAGVSADLVAVAGFRFSQPLWFLAVFLLCQALLPLAVRLHERAPVRTLGMLVAGAVLVDVARALTGIDAIGFANLAFVWLALQQTGFFLADGTIDRLTRRVRGGLAATGAGMLTTSMMLGVHSPDLIANINPPTTALLMVGLTHTMLVSLHRRALVRGSRMPALAALRGFVTPRAMTIYLWHMAVLLVMAGVLALGAFVTGSELPAPGTSMWWATRPAWLALALVLTAALATGLSRLETVAAPAPAAPGRVAAAVIIGIAAVGMLLVIGTNAVTALLAAGMLGASLLLSGVVLGRVRWRSRELASCRVRRP